MKCVVLVGVVVVVVVASSCSAMCLHKYCTLRCVLDGNRIRYDDKPVSVCVCACVSSCNQLCLPVLSFAPHCCPLSRFPRDHPAQCVPSSLPTQVCPLRRPPYLPSVFPRPHLPRALCIALGLPLPPFFVPRPPPTSASENFSHQAQTCFRSLLCPSMAYVCNA